MQVDKELVEKIASDLDASIRRSELPIPVGVSNRHFHVTEEHWKTLFGSRRPAVLRHVGQPGQWAGKETIDVESPKGRIRKVRLLGPFRSRTQIEISRTDAIALGLDAPVRESGKIGGSASLKLIGPSGTVRLEAGVIIAQRHVHLPPADAARIGVEDRETVRVRAGTGGPRELVFENVLARVSDTAGLEFHVDTDEANAAWLKNGDLVRII